MFAGGNVLDSEEIKHSSFPGEFVFSWEEREKNKDKRSES